MNRRDIMKLFGLGAAAATTPVIVAAPVAAAPTLKSIEHPLHKHFLAPLDAYVHMKGGHVYQYRAHRHPDVQSVRVSFNVHTSGIVDKVVLKRLGVELITIPQSSMDTPFATQGARINIDIDAKIG